MSTFLLQRDPTAICLSYQICIEAHEIISFLLTYLAMIKHIYFYVVNEYIVSEYVMIIKHCFDQRAIVLVRAVLFPFYTSFSVRIAFAFKLSEECIASGELDAFIHNVFEKLYTQIPATTGIQEYTSSSRSKLYS